MAIGDLLPRLKPNIAIGFRTAAMFENRGVWIRTHRFAGYASVSLGAVIVVAGLVLPRTTGEAVILTAAMCAAFSLVWYSRRVSRR
jgi:hypothetical protein